MKQARRQVTKTLLAGLGLTLLLGACEAPPVETQQIGYRGTATVQVSNPDRAPAAAEIPAAQPAASDAGPRASAVYRNVQVLGDLSVAEFTRTMQAITEWVSPEEGCNYCHLAEDLSSDDIYTKVVSRRMLQMTRHINGAWDEHVGETGVTCYSCHAGQAVPANIWFAGDTADASNFAGSTAGGQNRPNATVAYASLPVDPFSSYLGGSGEDQPAIRVLSTEASTEDPGATIQDTENTYGLMMHMSTALGVNCTYCHNSNSFGTWTGSTPQRVTAYHGIQMVRDLNQNYLTPLQSAYPENRLGPSGDAPKAYCATCHQGLQKPLDGARMAEAYPALWQ